MPALSQRFRPTLRRATAVVAAGATSCLLTLPPVHAAPMESARPSTTVPVDWGSGRGWPQTGGYPGYGSYPSTSSTSLASLDVSDASDVQSTGVVLISSTIDFGSGGAAGTGLVIDGEDGIVVTNHHVVEGSTAITVTVATTGESYEAEVLGTDATHDVAVLQLEDAGSLDAVSIDTDGVSVGDAIVAVGDAGGDGGSLTAASGVVTDDHEPVTVTEDDGSEKTIRNLIEVDADIISGDSGGALLDASGDVVGMNVAASSGQSDIVGYAIPIRRVVRIADAVLAGDESSTITLGYDAFLGVALDTTTGSATLAGVLDDGAAAAAGLTHGDTVTGLGGSTISSARQLRRAVGRLEAGDSTTVTWVDASGATHTAQITVGRAPVA